MKLKMKGLSLLLCSVASSGTVFAEEHPHGHFEALGTLGIAQSRSDNGQLGVTSSETDTLVQTNANNWKTFAAQLGAGYIHFFPNAQQYPTDVIWFPAIEPELNLYYLGSNSIQGNVWRFNNAAFNQLTYNTPIHSTRLMLDAALTVASWKQFSAYAIGGIGSAWNYTGYHDSDNDAGNSTDTCLDQRLNLNSNTNIRFAWEAGLGLTYAVTDRIGVSLEYLYADLGTGTSAASGNTGTITAPLISPASFKLTSQSALLGLHIAL